MIKLRFQKAPGTYAICQFSANGKVPEDVSDDAIIGIMRSPEETTLVVEVDHIPRNCTAVDKGWILFNIVGDFAFDESGIVLSAITPLSENDIGVFVLSTYSSDMILIKEGDSTRAKTQLESYGHFLGE